MSDSLKFPTDDTPADCGDNCGCAAGDDDYEEITSEEVDRIVAALDDLAESTESLNIRACLEEAAAGIYGLVYDDDGLEEAA